MPSLELSGISTRFRVLFQSDRQIAHVLLTRPPLTPKGSLDLHVLGTPPAFVLSQDQTLNQCVLSNIVSLSQDWYLWRGVCLVFKEPSLTADSLRPSALLRRRDSVTHSVYAPFVAPTRALNSSRLFVKVLTADSPE